MTWILRMLKLFLFKKKWRKHNKHNSTYPLDLFPLSVAKVGRYSYGGLKILAFGDDYRVAIGDFCSIGPNVLFVLKADHPINRLSTFPFKVKILGEQYEATSKGDIILEDDVWIGANVTILSGVHIGQGAVVAAGAVVSTDIPPYAIAGGVPAKVIRYRFDDELVKKLVELDYSLLDDKKIKDNLNSLYTPITADNLENIVNNCFSGKK